MDDEHRLNPHLTEAERRVLRSHAAARMHPAAPHRPTTTRWKRWGIIAGGWFFIVLGVAGLVLPFLQGILFLVIGMALLAREVVWVQRLRERLYRRWPKLRDWSDEGERWSERQWHRLRGWFRRA